LIRYTVSDSHLGRVLLAATPRGVCAVSFAETESALIRQLEALFPTETIARDDRGLARWMTELLRVVAGASAEVELPLDIRGTPFQQRVWNAMRRIPRGQTRSYSEVARMLGKPLAARAVARACALNPAMILIPCHRVIAGDGTVRGGPTCKTRRERLLEAERHGL
jgi:AraC family transcriptional regulator of adaptative response/methylated-DNA-[protein]-cysteine methyltransferase